MGFFGRKRAPSVPHPRKEPRFDGPLTLKRLEQIFQDWPHCAISPAW